ncbi:hypothetical protein BDR22DRAFT_896156 [Usnea florida]
MWTSPIRIIFSFSCLVIALVRADVYSPMIKKIIEAANAGHVLPDWYRALVPVTAGKAQPQWSIQSNLDFMASIDHDIVTISTPGSAVYPGNEVFSVGLARLMNEWLSALVRTYPGLFSFYTTTPLPYVAAAIKEVEYARSHLGAIGTGLFSNYEGKYLGNPELTPFFAYLQSRETPFEVVFIHSSSPLLNINGTFISGNPTIYPDAYAEFFFETARTVMDLTTSQTIQNFTKIRYQIPSAGGSLPSIEDRFLKSYYPALETSAKAAYNKRFWWDSAGPTFYHQVQGLLVYSIPASELLFGTDWPYRPPFEYPGDIEAIIDAAFITAADKKGIFRANAEDLHGLTF